MPHVAKYIVKPLDDSRETQFVTDNYTHCANARFIKSNATSKMPPPGVYLRAMGVNPLNKAAAPVGMKSKGKWSQKNASAGRHKGEGGGWGGGEGGGGPSCLLR